MGQYNIPDKGGKEGRKEDEEEALCNGSRFGAYLPYRLLTGLFLLKIELRLICSRNQIHFRNERRKTWT